MWIWKGDIEHYKYVESDQLSWRLAGNDLIRAFSASPSNNKQHIFPIKNKAESVSRSALKRSYNNPP